VDAVELLRSDSPFIADTSAWWRVASLPSELGALFQAAVIDDRLWITPIVRMEILYSARSSSEYVALETELDALRIVRDDRSVTDAAMHAIGVAVDSLSLPSAPPPNSSTVPPSNNTEAPLPSHTTITKATINKKKRKATFAFTAASATSYQCELVEPKKGKHHKKPQGTFGPCGSPTTYKHLTHGRYTFEVRGVNSTGADSTSAVKKFKI
jgi:hypothetical protein